MKTKAIIILAVLVLIGIASDTFAQSGQITTLGNAATGSGAVVLQTGATLNNVTLSGTTVNVSGTGALALASGTNNFNGNLSATGTTSIPASGVFVLSGTAAPATRGGTVLSGSALKVYITGSTGILIQSGTVTTF